MNNPTPYTQQIVHLLQEIESGNKASLEKLYNITYQDLKNMAHGIKVRFHGQHTLNTTALVHEAYLKINKAHHLTFNNKAHYLGTLGKVIRHVLINYIEQKRSQKRGNLQKAYSLDDWQERISVPEGLCDQILQLHEALQLLAQEHEMMASIIEYRFFANMSIDEIAQVLSVSPSTVKRQWNKAKIWLYQQLQKAH
ncbi:MAG TPA: hypothetical protein DCS93_30095 [Microscillaceae bacterium]|nr:hypothetical protein [Microscillaceae bacterium]